MHVRSRLALASLALLLACSGGEDDAPSELDGTWVQCNFMGALRPWLPLPTDVRVTLTITGTTVVEALAEHSTLDLSCGGTQAASGDRTEWKATIGEALSLELDGRTLQGFAWTLAVDGWTLHQVAYHDTARQQLFLGDLRAEYGRDGSTASARPRRLYPVPFGRGAPPAPVAPPDRAAARLLPRPAGAGFTVSGRVHVPPGSQMDADGGASLPPSESNDSAAAAQQLFGPPGTLAVVTGLVSPEDPVDWYRVTLGPEEHVLLWALDRAWNNLGITVCARTPGGPQECVGPTHDLSALDPGPGERELSVTAAGGAATYLLMVERGDVPYYVNRRPAGDEVEVVPGEVIVRFDDAGDAGPGARAATLGLELLAGGPGRPVLLGLGTGERRAAALRRLGVAAQGLRVSAAEDERLVTVRAAAALATLPGVRYAHPNHLVRPGAADPLRAWQWGLDMIRVPQARALPADAPPGDVVVAVADSGIIADHPDLADRLVAGYDFVRGASGAGDGDGIDPDPDDAGLLFHGTAVAGVIAAATDGIGVEGVAPSARIMPLRTVNAEFGISNYDQIQAERFAAGLPNDSGTVPARRADVLNLSSYAFEASQAEAETLQAVLGAGVVVVSIAGNHGDERPAWPGAFPGVISTVALDASGALASYSGFGSTVDVAAPGGEDHDADFDRYPEGVLTTGGVPPVAGPREPAWEFVQGTSYAAPHVAGVVALMLEACHGLRPDRIMALLAAGALTEDLGAPGRDDRFGHGLIDAAKAVEAARRECGRQPAAWLEAWPTRAVFPLGSDATLLEVRRVGEAARSLAAVHASSAWLSVEPVAADPVTGLGSYRLAIDREMLGPGVHRAELLLLDDASGELTVPIVAVSARAAADLGPVMVALVPEGLATGGWVSALTVAYPSPSGYTFRFEDVPPGRYSVHASTDVSGHEGPWGSGADHRVGGDPNNPPAPQVVVGGDVDDLELALYPPWLPDLYVP